MSPPERRNPPGNASQGAPTSSKPTNTDSTSYVQGLRRRRAAASWMRPLQSGLQDPWHYEPPTSGYEAAAAHLLEEGLTPAPNREALQAMRKRGGHHYRTAKLITERWGGAE